MNYKDQILKEFANSGYDKKTYLGLVKKKTHHMRNVNYIDGTKHDNFDNQNNSKAESKIINIDKNKKNNSDDIFTEQVDPETGINVLDDNNDKIPETEKNKLIENKISDFVFGYRFYEITTLPEYFIVYLNPFDVIGKQMNTIKINTTLTLTANGTTVIYFMLAIIVHRGNDIKSGHYTILVYDNKMGTNFNYIYYDDATSKIVNMPVGTKIIPQTLYIKDPTTETAFIVLYGDITKLR